MGSAMAKSLARGGAHVVATLEGRSERTARLAERADVEILPNLHALVGQADVILSIVPPEAATAVAKAVCNAAKGASNALFVEMNAIAPETVLQIESAVSGVGLETIDGSISGPPPWRPGTTRIYLSGQRAHEIAALPFDGVDRIVVGDGVGAASAVKMSTASVYKGSTAILLQALRSAHTNGVLEHVLRDLRAAAPELVANVERRLAMAASKSERYVGEMHEIARTQSGAGLTPALFEAMAEVYASLAQAPAAERPPEEIADDKSLPPILDAMRGLCSSRMTYARPTVATIADIMTRGLLSVAPDAALTKIAADMNERRVGAVVVLEGDALVGILTERDILRAVGEGRVEGSRVAECMTPHPETIEPSESTDAAATLMIHGGFRHLPVVEDGNVVGIVSIRDLMRVVLDDSAPRGV